jgi:two-component system phosphate regulon sensor histidine kinase PhoR
MFLIIIGILITGFFTSELAQKLYKYETEEKLINAARLIQYQVTEDISLSHNIDYNNLAVKYAGILDAEKISSSSIAHGSETRITFIDFKGNVLGESEADFHSMGNHLHRKEIQESLQGKVGKDIRFSNTLGVDFLYIAVPLTSSEIIIRISVPLVQLKRIDQIIWVYTAIGILAGLLLTTILALRFSSSMIHPINELISVSKEISEVIFKACANKYKR